MLGDLILWYPAPNVKQACRPERAFGRTEIPFSSVLPRRKNAEREIREAVLCEIVDFGKK